MRDGRACDDCHLVPHHRALHDWSISEITVSRYGIVNRQLIPSAASPSWERSRQRDTTATRG